MVRDWELVRAILLATDSSSPQTMASPTVSSEPLRIDGYDDLVVTQHVVLLEQKGLVTANYITANGVGRAHARNVQLTWDGHEFLDNARNDTIWKVAGYCEARWERFIRRAESNPGRTR